MISFWTMLTLTVAYLPRIVRYAKQGDIVDAHMISTIRGVIIAYFIVSMLGYAAWFVSRFLGY